jgi:hypothetical protein
MKKYKMLDAYRMHGQEYGYKILVGKLIGRNKFNVILKRVLGSMSGH